MLEFAHDLMGSPWIYLLVFAVAALDGFFPVVPSESLVITAGVFAASDGGPAPLPLVAAAALGAIAGDHVSYLIGRRAGPRLSGRRGYDRAARAVAERGGTILVVARYVPGGRTATTLVMGATGYPARRFARFDVLAGLSWAVYSVLVGHIGGAAFENDPVRGLLLGLGLALTVTAGVEITRKVRNGTARGDRGRVDEAVDGPGHLVVAGPVRGDDDADQRPARGGA
ncbi:DedA family protein [Actinocorallia longicatena]|uniref:VTT domain-containing protein n=1 Tax=Actinocorallia longicatena TaxID=111803 RepID=A0ABP6QFF9_9ACTN